MNTIAKTVFAILAGVAVGTSVYVWVFPGVNDSRQSAAPLTSSSRMVVAEHLVADGLRVTILRDSANGVEYLVVCKQVGTGGCGVTEIVR